MYFFLLHIPSNVEIDKEKEKLFHLSIDHWLQHDLFSINWWILLLATIIPYFIWWRVVDKNRFFEVFSYGMFCATLCMLLDIIGTEMLLWNYPDKLLPLITPLIPANLVVIPITAMLVYQYFSTWKYFLLATLGWSTLFSYIIEPLFMLRKMFVLGENWSHAKSFIGFIFLGLLLKAVFENIKKHVLK
ncbi:CBO0543 family protein [Niallia sp. JL1B1071]|uniref:CBO0543 family protein n=1 Tax=Niallia tiangongensis TaxID=3237105 RepID=UPI0037DC5890